MKNEFEQLCEGVIEEGWRSRFKGLKSGIKTSKETNLQRKQEMKVFYNNIKADSELRIILEKFRNKALKTIGKDTEETYKIIRNMGKIMDDHIKNSSEQIKKVSEKYGQNYNSDKLELQFSQDMDILLNEFRDKLDNAINNLKDKVQDYQFDINRGEIV